MLSELNEVNDHLFITGFRSVTDESIKNVGVTCVINCSLTVPFYSTHNLKYTALLLEDNDKANISQHFDEVCNIIAEEHQNGGKTLVYCVAGISRSATLCLAYLMKSTDMNLRAAFRYLRSRRRIVRPNNNFFSQLIDYERSLFNQTSVEMVRVPQCGEHPDSNCTDCVVPDVFYEVCKGIVWFKSAKKTLQAQGRK